MISSDCFSRIKTLGLILLSGFLVACSGGDENSDNGRSINQEPIELIDHRDSTMLANSGFFIVSESANCKEENKVLDTCLQGIEVLCRGILPALSLAYIDSAEISHNEAGAFLILHFDEEGGALFSDLTAANIDQRLGIIIDGEFLSAPWIKAQITGGKVSLQVGDGRTLDYRYWKSKIDKSPK